MYNRMLFFPLVSHSLFFFFLPFFLDIYVPFFCVTFSLWALNSFFDELFFVCFVLFFLSFCLTHFYIHLFISWEKYVMRINELMIQFNAVINYLSCAQYQGDFIQNR